MMPSANIRFLEPGAPSVLEAVRRGFAAIGAMARHVRIRGDRIAEYAASLPVTRPPDTYDLDHHYLGDTESTVSYVLAVEGVNFGSGYQPALLAEGWRLIDGSQYFTVAQALKKHYGSCKPLDAVAFSGMTGEACRALFALPEGPAARELAELFADSLREIGDLVQARYEGRFLSFVRAAGGSEDRFVRMLSETRSFGDIQDYRGLRLPILKRAQLAAAVLRIEFERLDEPLFDGPSRTTMFADNGVPHVLHTDGILEYDPALLARIRAEEEIPAGSEEEIEIRACAGHAVELIAAQKGMASADIDFILWHRSVGERRYQEHPTHRTRSRYY